jgi:hypothetical protein
MSRMFVSVQKYLQITIFSPNAFLKRSLSFAWVAARLLHSVSLLGVCRRDNVVRIRG